MIGICHRLPRSNTPLTPINVLFMTTLKVLLFILQGLGGGFLMVVGIFGGVVGWWGVEEGGEEGGGVGTAFGGGVARDGGVLGF